MRSALLFLPLPLRLTLTLTMTLTLLCASATAAPVHTEPAQDPYLWLEQVHGEQALAWARARNATSQAALEAVPCASERMLVEEWRLRVLLRSRAKRQSGRPLTESSWQD